MVTQWTIMNLKVASLTGPSPNGLAGFEAELPSAALRRMRKQASNEVTDASSNDEMGLSDDELRPDALALLGVFPKYRSGKGGLRLLMQYGQQSCHVCGDATWTDGYYTAQVTTEYPPSSSLTPPSDALALLEYVWREHSTWKPIGWSRKL
jgi:hypothetical protein